MHRTLFQDCLKMLPASPVFFLCNFHPTFLCFESMLTWWLSSIALEIWTGSLVQPVRSKTQHVILSVTYKATWQCVFNWTTINPGNGAPQPSSGRMAQSSISMQTESLQLTTNACLTWHQSLFYKSECGDFPGSPVVKNPSSKAGNMGSIPGQGSKIPQAMGQLRPNAVK